MKLSQWLGFRSEAPMNLATPYGAVELRSLYKHNAGRALAIAVTLHLLLLGSYFAVKYIAAGEEPTYTVRILKYSDLGPPPSIQNSQSVPAVSVAAPTAKPSVGTPVPVPDVEINPEQTIATQQELAAMPSISDDLGEGSGPVQIEIDEPPADFVPVEKQPQPIKVVQPTYPEIAQEVGVEGTVWAKIWVDKEGKPKKVVIIKSDAEVFNQPVIEAAMKWTFTPAIMNAGPVAVWVSIPFRFKLNK